MRSLGAHGSPGLRPMTWLLSFAAHLIAAALLLETASRVRPELQPRYEEVGFVVEPAPSLPGTTTARPDETEPSTPESMPPDAEGTIPPVPAPNAPPPDTQAPPSPAKADQPPPASLPATSPAPTTFHRLTPGQAATRSAQSKRVQHRPSMSEPLPITTNDTAPEKTSGHQSPSAPGAALAQPPTQLNIIDPSWRGALNAWMQAHRHYPDMARQRGEEGVVGVTFSVSPDGIVLAVQIVRPSGSASLDQTVYEMLAGQKVPALPPGTTQTPTRITVNVRFSLDH